ncbi:GntR family transcriptional regulator [Desulfosporosinus nitroreducens]|uniref:GntR family transcriptional regulator n=1 Tax=Desulfosporosinus nitroreducens TaxID=2018668 RepID=A0ABT8QW61_9FIRM|nr:GntR family transcriptional regulator [Desulfosporosinus nitroreducens]MDO0825581.1 GntR family transcriptional regulator [Desulfosporosinus nitroreducens]
MPHIPKLDNEQLSSKAHKILLAMLREGAFDQSGKLPPEEILAQKLGISRSVVRDVLAAFESEGFITRRRGIGTIINKHVLKVTSRLDLEKEFLEEVADCGYTPSVGFVTPSVIKADEEAAERLEIPVGEELIVVERLILANGQPAIYCIDHLSSSLIIDNNYSLNDLKPPIFSFLEQYCHCSVQMDLTKIAPYLTDDHLAEILNISQGTPILYLDELGYDIHQKPVLWSKEYYAPGIFEFTVLRRKI